MNAFNLFSKNGIILPNDQATVSLFNIEYSYGYGVYETLKVRNGILYFTDQHLERLEHSAKTLQIQLPFSLGEIKQFIISFIKELGVDSCNIKVLLIGGSDTKIYIFASAPLYPDRKLYSQGASLMTYIYERLFPTAKTLNMLPSYMAYKKAKEQGHYDALLLNNQGIMLEGTRTNFFVVKDKTIFCAPKKMILAGVTFLTLSIVAKKQHYNLKETEIPFRDINKYDGAFITSTSTKIMPIRTIDAFSYESIPDSIKLLMKAYDEYLAESKGVL